MESLAPYPNLTLRPDTVNEFHSLFKDLDAGRFKVAMQSAVLDSQDFFPTPAKIKTHYDTLFEESNTISKSWSQDGKTMTVIKSYKDDRGRVQEDKRLYTDIGYSDMDRIALDKWKNGQVRVITNHNEGRLSYCWQKHEYAKDSSLCKLLGYKKIGDANIPIYQYLD